MHHQPYLNSPGGPRPWTQQDSTPHRERILSPARQVARGRAQDALAVGVLDELTHVRQQLRALDRQHLLDQQCRQHLLAREQLLQQAQAAGLDPPPLAKWDSAPAERLSGFQPLPPPPAAGHLASSSLAR